MINCDYIGYIPSLSANSKYKSAVNQIFAADLIFNTYKYPYNLQAKPHYIQGSRYHRKSFPLAKVSWVVRRENKVSLFFNQQHRDEFLPQTSPFTGYFGLSPYILFWLFSHSPIPSQYFLSFHIQASDFVGNVFTLPLLPHKSIILSS